MVTNVPVLYLAFLGVLALERGAELWLSRRNARLAKARGAVEVGRGHFAVMGLFHAAFLAASALEVVCLTGTLRARGRPFSSRARSRRRRSGTGPSPRWGIGGTCGSW